MSAVKFVVLGKTIEGISTPNALDPIEENQRVNKWLGQGSRTLLRVVDVCRKAILGMVIIFDLEGN